MRINEAEDNVDGRRRRRKAALPKKLALSVVEGSVLKPNNACVLDPQVEETRSPKKCSQGTDHVNMLERNDPDTKSLEESHSLYRYNCSHKKRGLCLIISNSKFDSVTGMHDRTGADVDSDNIVSAFESLGFECMICAELTRAGLKAKVNDVSGRDFSNFDCFACVIMTHGESNGQLYMRDGLFVINDVLDVFKADRCPTLVGKPKLFFIQACRGGRLDNGFSLSTNHTDGEEIENQTQRVPLQADFLVAYSVSDGYYSFRNSHAGSWFIQALTRVLISHGHKLDLLTLLTRVNYIVAYEFESRARDAEMSKKKQVPCVQSMLTKQLFFHPK